MLEIKDLRGERWVEYVPKHPSHKQYYISNYGRFKSLDSETEIEQLFNGFWGPRGFRRVTARSKNKFVLNVALHSQVAKEFIPKKRKGDRYVIHLNGDRGNNHYKNLKWITREELNQIWKEKGVYDMTKRKPPRAKLTETDVKRLKRMLKRGKTKKTIIARQMGISYMQLNRIERGENWGHVTID